MLRFIAAANMLTKQLGIGSQYQCNNNDIRLPKHAHASSRNWTVLYYRVVTGV